MKVTNDKYQFPVAIADTAKELADICGVSKNTIYSCSWYFEKGEFTHSSYVKVKIDDD